MKTATELAQQIANQELEACCLEIADLSGFTLADKVRAARRPKPPSLAEEALEAMHRYEAEEWCEELTHDGNTIRRALERLQELEGGQ